MATWYCSTPGHLVLHCTVGGGSEKIGGGEAGCSESRYWVGRKKAHAEKYICEVIRDRGIRQWMGKRKEKIEGEEKDLGSRGGGAGREAKKEGGSVYM
jgi:hypothetical protein